MFMRHSWICNLSLTCNVMPLSRFGSQATKDVNNMTVKMPWQCFINGKFEDAENGKTANTVNPADGSVSCNARQIHLNTHTHTYSLILIYLTSIYTLTYTLIYILVDIIVLIGH